MSDDDVRQERELQAANERLDMAWTVSDPRGRRVLMRLIDNCGIDRPLPTTEPMMANLAEGRRRVGIELAQTIRRDHADAWRAMQDG